MGNPFQTNIAREVRVQMARAVRRLDQLERGLVDKITFEPTVVQAGKDLFAYSGKARREVTTRGGRLVAVRDYPFHGEVRANVAPSALKGFRGRPQDWAAFSNGRVEGRFLQLDRSLLDVRVDRALDAFDATTGQAGVAARRVDRAILATPVLNKAYAPVRQAAIGVGHVVGQVAVALLKGLQPVVPKL